MIDVDSISRAFRTLQSYTRKDSKWAKAAAGGLLGVSVYRQGREVYNQYRAWSDYTITVLDDEPIYWDALHWVLDRLPSERRRAVKARVDHDSFMSVGLVIADDGDPVPAEPPQRRTEVQFAHDGARAAHVILDGHRVKIEVKAESRISDWGGGRDDRRSRLDPGAVVFTVRTAAARDAVARLIQSFADDRYNRTADGEARPIVPVFQLSRWGNWHRSESLGRRLSSVVLADGLAERIAGDLRYFLDQEDRYVAAGLPWHRGYLFHGPPGTGKSSLPKAIAYEFGMPIYVVSLSDLTKDADLASALANVAPRSILLIEDIDVAHAAKERDDTDGGISLSGLLNALDGVATPHGLVTIMTTNNVDALDDALIRVGRADVTEHFDYPTRDEFVDLVAIVTGLEPAVLELELPDLPAEQPHAAIVGWMKNHLGEPWDAVAAVRTAIEAGPPYPAPAPRVRAGVVSVDTW